MMTLYFIIHQVLRGLGALLVRQSTWRTWQLILLCSFVLFTWYHFQSKVDTAQQATTTLLRQNSRLKQERTIQQAKIETLVANILHHVSNADSAETNRKQLIQDVYALPADSLQAVLDSVFAIDQTRYDPAATQTRSTNRTSGKAGHR